MNIKSVLLSVGILALTACGGNSYKPVVASSIPPEKAYEYAIKAMSHQEYEQAIPLLEIAAAQVGSGVEPKANLGVAHLRSGSYDKGMEILKSTLLVAPGNADILNEMALAHRKQGEFAEARKRYEQILSVEPGNLKANYNLGILCDLYQQDLDCAIARYKQYLAAYGQDDKKVQIWLNDVEKRKALTGEGG